MTPTKVLLAAALTLAVLAAGCAGNDDGDEATDGQNASDENSSLYTGDEAPGLAENAPGSSGNSTASNETSTSG